jgi:hypothetical protein
VSRAPPRPAAPARAAAHPPLPRARRSPGRIRIAFGAASGVDDDGEAVYSWNRRGWGGGGHCLSNSLGDEKPRFYLTPRQGAEILAAPFREHSWGAVPGAPPRRGGAGRGTRTGGGGGARGRGALQARRVGKAHWTIDLLHTLFFAPPLPVAPLSINKDCKFLGWRGNEDGCPKIWVRQARSGSVLACLMGGVAPGIHCLTPNQPHVPQPRLTRPQTLTLALPSGPPAHNPPPPARPRRTRASARAGLRWSRR